MTALAVEATAPADCVHTMMAAVLFLLDRGVRIEWADLGDDVGHWLPEDRTLLVDSASPMADQARVLVELRDLCEGRGDGSWERVRPQLRLVT